MAARWTLSALVLLASLLNADAQGIGPGPAGGAGDAPSGGPSGFALIMCNRSKEHVAFVAIGQRVVGPTDNTRVQGWWQISEGQCVQIGVLPQPGFVFHARSPGGISWSGSNSKSLCINPRERFDQTVATNAEVKQCPPDFVLAPFAFVEVSANQKVYTMNLN